MPGWADEQVKLRDRFQSKYEKASLEDLEWRASEKNARDLQKAVPAALKFINELDSWMVLSGPYGTGKTHIMRAIATEIAPIGLFITATDFERMIFENVKSGTLDSFVLTVSQAAVLLFDDFGAEYGSDIVRSQIAAVFIARDHQARDLPTVVTTNLDREQIARVPRVGSRLLNEDTVKFISINMDDYRTREYRVTHPRKQEPKW
jgi:DNA replication protein DnaC